MTLLDSTSFARITSTETLTGAHKKAMAGKRSNQKATNADYQFMSYLLIIQAALWTGDYVPAPYRRKLIVEPKVRRIEAPAFRDRVVQHAIHSVLSPFYERHFINDSYACRPDKGIHRAMQRVQYFLHNSQHVYVCKIDISKYYGSVNHSKLKQILIQKINDEQVLRLLDTIIDSSDSGTEYDHLFPPDSYFHTKGRRGIPIGNLTSQLFANVYLHELDMFIKQRLHIRRYVRYMDDILLFHEDKAVLQVWQKQIADFLYNELYLTINPKKVRIYPSRLGVDFVGYVIYPHTTRIRASALRRFRRKFHKQLTHYLAGRVSKSSIEATYNSWVAHAKHGGGEPVIEQMRQKKEDYYFIRSVQQAYKRQTKKQ